MTMRDDLRFLLSERTRLADASVALTTEADEGYRAALDAYASLIKLRGKKRAERLEEWEVAIIRDQFMRQYAPRYEQLQSEKRWVKHEVTRLAEQLRPESGEQWLELTRTYPHHTQGFGADRYGEGDAQVYASEREGLGVEVRVRKVTEGEPRRDRWGSDASYRYWIVEALVRDEVDVEILRAHNADMAMWLAACWKRGVNPRVLLPGLPHGLEEKLGVDYFGNRAAGA